MKNRILAMVVGMMAFAAAAGDTSWMRDSFGLAFHWTASCVAEGETTPAYNDWNTTVNNFNAERFANTVQSCGAKHIIFTLTHARQQMACPNAHLDAILAGRTSTRDLIGDIITACTNRGIKVILYYNHSCNNSDDTEWKSAVGWNDITDAQSCTNYCDKLKGIVQEISDRYGKGIAGWWHDSAKDQYIANNQTFPWDYYVPAFKHGNADVAFAINRDVNNTDVTWSGVDYAAGESTKALDNYEPIANQQQDDIAEHIWTCMDNTAWVMTSSANSFCASRFSTEDALNTWLTKHRQGGRMRTLNVFIDKNGKMNPASIEQLRGAQSVDGSLAVSVRPVEVNAHDVTAAVIVSGATAAKLPISVTVEVATDSAFTAVVKTATGITVSADDSSQNVSITGLARDTVYYVRGVFTAADSAVSYSTVQTITTRDNDARGFWTTGHWYWNGDNAWAAVPAASNAIRSVNATLESGSWQKEGQMGDDGAVLTDGAIPATDNVNDAAKANIRGIAEWSVLSWELTEASDIYGFNVFTKWGGNGRDGVSIAKLEVKHSGSSVWIDLDNPGVCKGYGNKNGTPYAYYAKLATEDGTPLASDVTAIRVTLGEQENSWCGYAEMELVSCPTQGDDPGPTPTPKKYAWREWFTETLAENAEVAEDATYTYTPSPASTEGANVKVGGSVMVTVSDNAPTLPATAKAGFYFKNTSPITVYGYGSAGWQALSGDISLTESNNVDYVMTCDLTAKTVTYTIDGTALTPALSLDSGMTQVTKLNYIGPGEYGSFQGQQYLEVNRGLIILCR